jgi:hypothetical protein
MPLGEFQEALCLGEGLPLMMEPARLESRPRGNKRRHGQIGDAALIRGPRVPVKGALNANKSPYARYFDCPLYQGRERVHRGRASCVSSRVHASMPQFCKVWLFLRPKSRVFLSETFDGDATLRSRSHPSKSLSRC